MATLSGTNGFTGGFQPEATVLPKIGKPDFNHGAHGVDEKLSSGAAAFKSHSERFIKEAEGIDVLRRSADPTVTKAAYLATVEKRVGQYRSNFDKSHENVMRSLRSSLTEAEVKLATKVGIKPGPYDGEVRRALLSMPAEERAAAVRKAFADGDMATIGAVVGVPAITHGVDPALIDPLLSEFKGRVAPGEVAAVETHKQYIAWAEGQTRAMMNYEVAALSGTNGYLAKKQMRDSILRSYGIGDEAPEAAEAAE